MTLLKIFRS